MDKKGSNPGAAMESALVGDGDLSPAARESFSERHYKPEQLADLWNLSRDAVRRLFENEPGVFVLEGNGMRYGKHRYRTLRIPASVAERVHRRLSVAGGEKFCLSGQKK